jgi:hypothetical protein
VDGRLLECRELKRKASLHVTDFPEEAGAFKFISRHSLSSEDTFAIYQIQGVSLAGTKREETPAS